MVIGIGHGIGGAGTGLGIQGGTTVGTEIVDTVVTVVVTKVAIVGIPETMLAIVVITPATTGNKTSVVRIILF